MRKGSSIEVLIDYRRREIDGYGTGVEDRSKLGLFLSQEVDEVDLILESDSFGDETARAAAKRAKRRGIRKRMVDPQSEVKRRADGQNRYTNYSLAASTFGCLSPLRDSSC